MRRRFGCVCVLRQADRVEPVAQWASVIEGACRTIVCIEATGDICVQPAEKNRLIAELYRLLRPGGHVDFSDLALWACPPPAADRALRAVLYHTGAELVTDWPAVFADHGFRVLEQRDIVANTMPTWEHARAVYTRKGGEVERRYGQRIANRTRAHLDRITTILGEHGSFPVLSAQKPEQPA